MQAAGGAGRSPWAAELGVLVSAGGFGLGLPSPEELREPWRQVLGLQGTGGMWRSLGRDPELLFQVFGRRPALGCGWGARRHCPHLCLGWRESRCGFGCGLEAGAHVAQTEKAQTTGQELRRTRTVSIMDTSEQGCPGDPLRGTAWEVALTGPHEAAQGADSPFLPCAVGEVRVHVCDCACVHMCVHVCVSLCACVCTCMYVRACACACVHVHVCVSMCMYV